MSHKILKKSRLILSFSVAILVTITTSCGIYSFTGTSISPDIKTISIQNFGNESGLGPARLSLLYTEKLKEYFLQNTNLKLVKSDGDLQLEGAIVGYSLSPVGAQQGTIGNQQGTSQVQTALQNRLMIRVKTKFTNTKDETVNFEKEFSHYEDFASTVSLSAVETEKIDLVTERIVFDTFNASVANW